MDYRDTNGSGSCCAMPPKPLRYPISGPGPFRERSTFQVPVEGMTPLSQWISFQCDTLIHRIKTIIYQVPVASASYRGRVISPDLVPFPKDVLSSTEGTVFAYIIVLMRPIKVSHRKLSHCDKGVVSCLAFSCLKFRRSLLV